MSFAGDEEAVGALGTDAAVNLLSRLVFHAPVGRAVTRWPARSRTPAVSLKHRHQDRRRHILTLVEI
ncbi:hypothetical protein [Streptomyces sp. Inha503]|uniref:hypothetical protein n=1 Tax=Streptomyces sp. Inha503 TaxID=3383314 RepID=UPI00399EF449